MIQAPSNPTLPQDDTPAQRQARAAQLESARQTYEWTREVPTLPGVPLATGVPKADKPTLAYLAIVLGYGIEILRNQIGILLTFGTPEGDRASDHVAHAQERLGAIEASVREVGRRRDAVEHA